MSRAYPAPAQLNLMLRVVGRRADGYHELQTVFQFIDLHDTLYFESLPPGSIHRTGGPAGVPETADLTVRAAQKLLAESNIREGVHIHIDKQLPMGGGIGGGSSDAATTLLALNQLWNLGFTRTELMAMGVSLGADVPVFLFAQSAWGEGIGERLVAMPELPEAHYVLLHPGVSVATREIFAAPELTRQHAPITISAFLDGVTKNTLEATVRRRYPEIDRALDWLQAQGLRHPRLTGSGACCFAEAKDAQNAQQIVATVPKPWRAWAVRGCNRHPLHDLVRDALF
jgi:4-diphosphocytidyl-2-C-methyl-D-erythritol kinase